MIEFDGYITEKAEKFFWKKSRRMVQILFLITYLILLPIFLLIAIKTEYWRLLIGYAAFCASTFLIFLIPKSKKEKKMCNPKRIFVDEEYIVCVSEKYEEYRLISDADKLIDYGDFYYISFPVGKKSNNFVCQKSLLVKGTSEEFEELFADKVERRYELI